jgi:class 3 adenylate cyclase
MVDKFMGDCVMALFGASPLPAGEAGPTALDCRRHAVAAAEDMMRFVEATGEEWKRRWGFEIKLGIGISSGPALVGNLGSDVRMEFTAIGDTVNVASRLEGLARPGQVLATTDVVEATRSQFDFVSIGKVPLRGKSEDVEIHALVTE